MMMFLAGDENGSIVGNISYANGGDDDDSTGGSDEYVS